MARISTAERIATKVYLGATAAFAVLGVVTTLAGLVLLALGNP